MAITAADTLQCGASSLVSAHPNGVAPNLLRRWRRKAGEAETHEKSLNK
ncbi:MAG: transposase-like protein [Paracoccaceae bacterium]|jgi:transposase-like protein